MKQYDEAYLTTIPFCSLRKTNEKICPSLIRNKSWKNQFPTRASTVDITTVFYFEEFSHGIPNRSCGINE